MDGSFVPNISFGLPVIAALRPHSHLFFDTHLMMRNPYNLLEDFARAGADGLTIHIESESSIEKSLLKIRQLGLRAGLSLNPQTPVESILPYLEAVDLVLVMSVQPGFGGQTFQSTVLSKIEVLKAQRQKINGTFAIEIDGGINIQTAPVALEAGSDILVAGSAVFKGDPKSYGENADALLGVSAT